MGLAIKKGAELPASGVISDRPLWLTADKGQVVEDGDVKAAFLLVGAGSEITAEEMERHGLSVEDGRIVVPSTEPGKKKGK